MRAVERVYVVLPMLVVATEVVTWLTTLALASALMMTTAAEVVISAVAVDAITSLRSLAPTSIAAAKAIVLLITFDFLSSHHLGLNPRGGSGRFNDSGRPPRDGSRISETPRSEASHYERRSNSVSSSEHSDYSKERKRSKITRRIERNSSNVDNRLKSIEDQMRLSSLFHNYDQNFKVQRLILGMPSDED